MRAILLALFCTSCSTSGGEWRSESERSVCSARDALAAAKRSLRTQLVVNELSYAVTEDESSYYVAGRYKQATAAGWEPTVRVDRASCRVTTTRWE